MQNLKKLYSFLEKNLESYQKQMTIFGIFGVLNYPSFHLIWNKINPAEYANLILRLLAALFCLLLLLKPYWPNSLKKLLPLYWYITITYCLPFFGTYMVLMNNASVSWLMNAMLVLFILILITDWISFFIVLLIGLATGWLAYHFTTGAWFIENRDLGGPLSTYLFAILIGMIFSRTKAGIEEEKLKTLKSVAFSIAHELRTPLATIRNMIAALNMRIQRISNNASSVKATFLGDDVNELSRLFNTINNEIDSGFLFINMLLMNVKEEGSALNELTICSMKDCIHEALQRYPLQPEQRLIIQWNKDEDFLFQGKKELIIHVLFNLLKNAFYYLEKSNKKESHIKIWLDSVAKFHCLHFKDTGTGVSPMFLPHIFERFYSKTRHGTGLGLAFCKMIMERCGGKISCHSIEGQYTEFILYFPRLEMPLALEKKVNLLSE